MKGYVQSIPRFGYIISLISSQDVRDIYELRLILECAAACLAEQLTRQQILRSQERVLLKLQSRLENGIWLTEPQSASE